MVPVASIARETSRRAPSLASGAHGWERAGGGRGGLFKDPPRPAPALSPKRPSSWIPGSLPPLLPPRYVGLLLGSSGSVPGWRTDPVEPPSGVQGSCTPWTAGTPHGVRSVCGLASRAGAVSPSQSLSESPASPRCCEPCSLLGARGDEVDLWSFGDSLPKEGCKRVGHDLGTTNNTERKQPDACLTRMKNGMRVPTQGDLMEVTSYLRLAAAARHAPSSIQAWV